MTGIILVSSLMSFARSEKDLKIGDFEDELRDSKSGSIENHPLL